jgi:hypothetical protein
MKILDASNKLSIVEVQEELQEIRFRMENSWLDLPLAPFSQKLHEVFSTIREHLNFEECYYNMYKVLCSLL